jgi:hypothetical protein
MFYVVRAVHKFDFKLVINETPNKWWPAERRSCSDRDSCFWQDLYITPDHRLELIIDVSTFKGQAVQLFFLDCLTVEDGTDRLSRNFDNYQSTN